MSGQMPLHWEIVRDISGYHHDGIDYDKPVYRRTDGLAIIYHNLGEEGTP